MVASLAEEAREAQFPFHDLHRPPVPALESEAPRLPGWARCDYSGKRPSPELRLCYRASVVCDVVLFHKPGTGTVGPFEELEGDEGLQE